MDLNLNLNGHKYFKKTNIHFKIRLNKHIDKRKSDLNTLMKKESHIETVVRFVCDSQFKTELPSNVLSSGLDRYIKQFQDSVFIS